MTFMWLALLACSVQRNFVRRFHVVVVVVEYISEITAHFRFSGTIETAVLVIDIRLLIESGPSN